MNMKNMTQTETQIHPSHLGMIGKKVSVGAEGWIGIIEGVDSGDTFLVMPLESKLKKLVTVNIYDIREAE